MYDEVIKYKKNIEDHSKIEGRKAELLEGPKLYAYSLRDELLVGAVGADAGWIALIALLVARAIFHVAF